MSGPALIIRLEIEARPLVYIDALDEAEAERLDDWLNAHPEYLTVIHEMCLLSES